MELGMIGLGRMGGNLAQRLLQGKHHVIVYDLKKEEVRRVVKLGATGASSIADLIKKLAPPRAVWVMLPHGEATEKTIEILANSLAPGDTIIEGGNSNYQDSMRRAAAVKKKKIDYLDCGTSGGIWGLQEGYCLMVGGDKPVFRRLEPIFKTLAPSATTGYGYVGPSGAGHYVKMTHNCLEYGLMQSYAEAMELLKAKEEFKLDLGQVADIWSYGSVVRSWLLELTADVLKEDPKLDGIKGWVEDTGEGRWAIKESVDLAVPVPVLALALQARFRSRQDQPFGARLLNALRNKFGGHEIKK